MPPILEGDLPDHNSYKFVRQGKIIAYDDPFTNQHSDIVKNHNLVTEVDPDGKLIVSDAGAIHQKPTGEICTYGDSSTCVIQGDILQARIKTDKIISSQKKG